MGGAPRPDPQRTSQAPAPAPAAPLPARDCEPTHADLTANLTANLRACLQAYVDNMKSTGHVETGCIMGYWDAVAWTTSGLTVSADESWALSASPSLVHTCGQTAARQKSPNGSQRVRVFFFWGGGGAGVGGGGGGGGGGGENKGKKTK
eukprot:SAG31_NODE_3661_length_4013_cov_2.518140_6_plen_148_part_01